MSYRSLNIEERSFLQIGLTQGLSLRSIAQELNRSPSTLSREIKRSGDECDNYRACQAQQQVLQRHLSCRAKRKLIPGSAHRSRLQAP